MKIRTRFAPSPTGLLHIGGARTALFNYLFAKHTGGEFLLRIEDTDKERNTQEAVNIILEGLKWLNLTHDGEIVYQSTREARHAEVAKQLLEAGKAYYCYATPEELQQMREKAIAEHRPPRYDGRWRDRDPKEAPAGVKPAIRLKAPQTGETVIHDLVQGEVRVQNSELDDLIILRGDGTPTYQHAVVVDDHDAGITHVIRGDDHLTNTFRQYQIYQAMGWETPRFAHIPLIHGADGAKLSKRHGAVSVLEFRKAGILPEALCNYLLRLGWGHGDVEIIDREEAVKLFEITDVGRAASRMDYTKLMHVNGVWLRKADNEHLTQEVISRLTEKPAVTAGLLSLNEAGKAKIRALMPSLKERAKDLNGLADSAQFLVHALPLPFERKAAGLLSVEAKALLTDLLPFLGEASFTKEALHECLKAFAESKNLKLGQIAQPLRAALTGSVVSPGIDDVMAVLGKEETLLRIKAAFHISAAGDMV